MKFSKFKFKSIRKYILIIIGGLLFLLLFYTLSLAFPQPFFAYSLTRNNITAHSDQGFDIESMNKILARVESKLKKSVLFRPETKHQIFLVQTPWKFNYFAAQSPKVGGINYVYFNHSIFLRQADVVNNRLIGPSGNPVPGERTLEYFITHEITHTLEFESMAFGSYPFSTNWVLEGYCEYVAHDSQTYQQALDKYLSVTETSGAKYYTRVRVMTTYLLDVQKVAVKDLWSYADNFDEVLRQAIPDDKPAIDDSFKF